MVNNWRFIEHAGRWLLPPICLWCGDPGHAGRDLCAACFDDLPQAQHTCRTCALPLPATLDDASCARCLREPPPFDAAWSAFRYAQPIRFLHRHFKFREKFPSGRLLGELLALALEARYAGGTLPPPDRILVVPLHRRRLMRRGFNQSMELIRPAAKKLGIALDGRSLRRLKATAPQSDLPAQQRRQNVRGAFACSADLRGQTVAVFDDVVTTGHTMNEIARLVRAAGASRIEAWSLARAGQEV